VSSLDDLLKGNFVCILLTLLNVLYVAYTTLRNGKMEYWQNGQKAVVFLAGFSTL